MKKQIEVLDRKQMRNILGGVADGSGTPDSGSVPPSTGTGNSDADRYLKCDPTCKAEAGAWQTGIPGMSPPMGAPELTYAACMAACLSSAMN